MANSYHSPSSIHSESYNLYNTAALQPLPAGSSVTLKSIYECPWFLKVLGQEEYYTVMIRELEERTGYKMSQKCGQRIYSDPPNWTGPPPPRGSEVFLSIARDKYEFDLEPILSKFGQIYDLRLMVDFSGTNRGFAYVRYASPEVARRAVWGLNMTRDKRDIIKKAMMSDDNSELFVTGLPLHLTRDELYEHFSRRTERLVSVSICPSKIYHTPNRGFCFLEYANHSYAAQARRELLLDLYVQEWRMEISVNWSIPDKMKYEPEYTPAKTIHVSNIPTYFCTYNRFMSLLGSYSEIQYVTTLKVFHNKAFVEFSTRDEANYALHLLEGVKVEDRNLHVSWARPMRRSRERDITLRELSAANASRLRSRQGSPNLTLPFNSDTPAPQQSLYNSSSGNTGYGLRAEAPAFCYTSNITTYPNFECGSVSNTAGNVAIANCNINVNVQDAMSSVAQSLTNIQLPETPAPTNPRYRGTTPLPNVMSARFAAIPNVNYESSFNPASPVPMTPVTYLPQFNYPQWSTGQPMSPTVLNAPLSPAFVYPPSLSPSLMYAPGILSPIPRSPSTPVFPTNGNYFCSYF